jgi:hypothetical protein
MLTFTKEQIREISEELDCAVEHFIINKVAN